MRPGQLLTRVGIHRRLTCLAAGIAVVTLTATACSSSGSSNTSTGGSGNAGTGSSGGSVVKLFLSTSEGSPIIDNPEIALGAKAAVAAINKAGGVNGHTFALTVCNNQSVPTKSQDCARQAVKDKVAAMVGLQDLSSEQTLAVLKQAGIPSVGGQSDGNPADFTASNAYPLSLAAVNGYFAGPKAAIAAGKKRIAVVALDIPSAVQDAYLVKKVTQDLGGTFTGIIKIPASGVTDYGTYAQQLKNESPDATFQILNAAGEVGVAKSAAAIGLHNTWIESAAGFGTDVYGPNPGLFDGALVADAYPSITETSNSLIAAFTKDVKATGVDPQATQTKYPRWSVGVNAWLAVQAVATVVKGMKGDVTAASLTAALDATKSVTLPGAYKWSPGVAGPALWPRVSTFDYYFMTLKGQQLVVNSGPNDLSSIVPSSVPAS